MIVRWTAVAIAAVALFGGPAYSGPPPLTICCSCENVGSSTGCNVPPCNTQHSTLFSCLGGCEILNTPGNPCNLKVVSGATCSGPSCATTGCCELSSAARAGVTGEADSASCVEADQTTCMALPG